MKKYPDQKADVVPEAIRVLHSDGVVSFGYNFQHQAPGHEVGLENVCHTCSGRRCGAGGVKRWKFFTEIETKLLQECLDEGRSGH